MRATVALLCLVAVAPAAAAAQEIPRTDYGTFNFERELGVMSGVVAGTPDSVFRAVKTVLTDLGVTLKAVDPDGLQLGATRAKVSRRLGKRPVSFYLSCGDGMTGPNADNWQVFLTLTAQFLGAPKSQTKLVLSVAADAIDIPNGRSDRVTCSTTGQLEFAVLRRLREIFPGTT